MLVHGFNMFQLDSFIRPCILQVLMLEKHCKRDPIKSQSNRSQENVGIEYF